MYGPVIQGNDPSVSGEANPDLVSQAEAEAGIATNERIWSALRVAQAIAALSTGDPDQTGAEIKALYEAEVNAFTDALFTKLSGIETGATADQTGAEIKALYEAEVNAFTDALFTKLSGIETGATADQTGAEIKALYEAEVNAFTDALFTKLSGIETGATANDTDANLKARANHTGTQTASTISNLATTVKAYLLHEFGAPTSTVDMGGQDVDNVKNVINDLKTITYAASVALNFNDEELNTISLTGNITFTTSNLAIGRKKTIRIKSDASSRTLTFPATWTFMGTKPTATTASKDSMLSLISYGTTDADVIAVFAEEE